MGGVFDFAMNPPTALSFISYFQYMSERIYCQPLWLRLLCAIMNAEAKSTCQYSSLPFARGRHSMIPPPRTTSPL